MEPIALSDDQNRVLGLAQMIQLLTLDRDHVMPQGAEAHQQREDVLGAVRHVFCAAVRGLETPFPNRDGTELDFLTATAWDNVLAEQSNPTAVVPHEEARDAVAAAERLSAIQRQTSLLDETTPVADFIFLTSFPGKERFFPAQEQLAVIFKNAKAAITFFWNATLNDPEIPKLLDMMQAGTSAELDDPIGAYNRRSINGPGASVDAKLTRAAAYATCQSAYAEALKQDNFEPLIVPLRNLFAALRAYYTPIADAMGISPYDAWLDGPNPGLRLDHVQPVFEGLATNLPPLIQRIAETQKNWGPLTDIPPVPVPVQAKALRRVLNALGFDPERSVYAPAMPGRMAFSMGSWNDTRFSVVLEATNIMRGVTSGIHELGHTLYGRGLPRTHQYQPVGRVQSYWINETQAIFWERQVAGTRAFMEFYERILRDELAKDSSTRNLAHHPAFSAENMYRLNMRFRNGPIRLGADEAHYPLHVLVRTDMEPELFYGRMQVEDIPARWKHGMQHHLGIDIGNTMRKGSLQDDHWGNGTSFVQYPLGMVGAAQLMEAYRRENPDTDDQIRNGSFEGMIKWLGHHIHRHGSRYSGPELIQRATGKPLSHDDFLASLERRYAAPNSHCTVPSPLPPSARTSCFTL